MHIYFRKNYRSVRVCAPVYAFGRSSTYQVCGYSLEGCQANVVA